MVWGMDLAVMSILVAGHPFWTEVCDVSSSKHLQDLTRGQTVALGERMITLPQVSQASWQAGELCAKG